MKILAIGQLPKEVGGNYTTGAGKVVYELSRQDYGEDSLATLALNCRDDVLSDKKYIGYRIPWRELLIETLTRPATLIGEIFDYWRHLTYSPLRGVFYRINMERALKAEKPDVVHIHSVGQVLPFSHTRRDENVKCMVTCHGIFSASDKETQDSFYREVMTRVDGASGLTKDIDRQLREYGVEDERRFIVPNGVDEKKFYFDAAERTRIRKDFGVPEQRRVFLTVASLQKRKGQLDFLKLLSRSGVDFEYWLIGEGPDREQIAAFAEAEGISGRVRLIGYVNGEDIFRYYSAADIYAHVSYAEGQALSEIEAYTTGMKILVNEDVRDTLANETEGNPRYRLISLTSVPDWQGIREWAEADTGERVTDGRLNWQAVADSYRAVYRKLAAMKSRASS